MAWKTPQEAASKWQQRVQSSGQFYQQGVQNTTKDWAQNSIAAADRRNQGLIAAINSGRIDAGIQRAGTAKWKANTLSKGVSAWTQNTAAALPRYAAGISKVYNYMQAAENAISGMPGTTRAERIARAGVFQNTVGEQADAAKNTP